MRHELPLAHKNLYGGLILGVNTLYRFFCFFNMVGKGLIYQPVHIILMPTLISLDHLTIVSRVVLLIDCYH